MKTLLFPIAVLFTFMASGREVIPGDSLTGKPDPASCYPVVGVRWQQAMQLPEPITIRSIDPIKLCNGSFSAIMNTCIAEAIRELRTGFDSLSFEAKEVRAKQITRLNERMLSGYGALHPMGIRTFNRQQLLRLPQRDINAVAGLVAGVDSRNGAQPNIKGARADGTVYFVDGVRIY